MNNRDFFCSRCSLQFDNKSIFDMHLSIVHGVRIETKEEDVICKDETNLDFKKKLLCDFRDSDQQIVSQHNAYPRISTTIFLPHLNFEDFWEGALVSKP